MNYYTDDELDELEAVKERDWDQELKDNGIDLDAEC